MRPEPTPSRAPLVEPGHTFASVTDKISAVVLTQPTPRIWYAGFAVGFALLMLMFWALANVVVRGVGLYGVNIPVGWGFAIVNFVWWIGIGHAGMLISARCMRSPSRRCPNRRRSSRRKRTACRTLRGRGQRFLCPTVINTHWKCSHRRTRQGWRAATSSSGRATRSVRSRTRSRRRC